MMTSEILLWVNLEIHDITTFFKENVISGNRKEVFSSMLVNWQDETLWWDCLILACFNETNNKATIINKIYTIPSFMDTNVPVFSLLIFTSYKNSVGYEKLSFEIALL